MSEPTSLLVFYNQQLRQERIIISEKIIKLLRLTDYPLTACEVATALLLPVTSVRPRITDLQQEKIIVFVGNRHCTVCCKKNKTYKGDKCRI